MDLSNKHVLILGLGESGLACTRWCDRQGAKVRVADTRKAPPYLAELQRRVTAADFFPASFDEGFDKSLLKGIDMLVLSPGLSGGLMAVIHARAAGIPVVGEIELFAAALRDVAKAGTADGTADGASVPVIAITGTNGKTTTTALTGHLLRATGKRVGVAGNISPAALNALMDAQDAGALPEVWVLELSSFQLETTESLYPQAATVLNISDDHLDRYIDVAEYASVKARVFDGEGVQVLNRQDRRVRRMARPGRTVCSFGLDAPADAQDFGVRENRGEPWLVQGDRFLLPLAQLPIAGSHNAANAMAALALCHSLGVDANALLPALREFRGLPHRVELVRQLDGVDWYDDSKGTNVGATVAALQGLGRKVVVILGGDGKGQDFSPLAPAIKAHARTAILIGRDGPLIEKEIQRSEVACFSADTLEEAVRKAQQLAQPGDAVLLSPACASFDMFRNYEHRASVFVDAVKALHERSATC